MSKKENKMYNITLKQFLLTYNFREYIDNIHLSENEKMDTSHIRIYLPSGNEFFEYGMYGFDNSYLMLKRINEIFNPKILNSYMYSMRVLDNSILAIYLSDEAKEIEV